jgi:hypothetical protein
MESLTDIAFPSANEFTFSISAAYQSLGGRDYLQDIIYESSLCLCPIASGPVCIVFMTLDARFVVLDDQWMGYIVMNNLDDLLAWMLHRPGVKCEEHQLDIA